MTTWDDMRLMGWMGAAFSALQCQWASLALSAGVILIAEWKLRNQPPAAS